MSGFLDTLGDAHERFLTNAVEVWLNENYPDVATDSSPMVRIRTVDTHNRRKIHELRTEIDNLKRRIRALEGTA